MQFDSTEDNDSKCKKLRFDFQDEWKLMRLSNILDSSSSNLSLDGLVDNIGNYKLYGATGIVKFIDSYEKDEDYLAIVKDGAGVGRTLLCDSHSSIVGTMQYLTPKENFNLHFCYYLLKNIEFRKYIVGSTIPHIYFKDYGKEKIFVPSLEEQEKIANFLSSVDQKIDLINQQLNQTTKFKKYLLQHLFTNKLSESDELQKLRFDFQDEWKKVNLGELIKDGKAGGTPSSTNPEYYGGNIPFLSIKDMSNQGKYIEKTEKTITEDGLNNSSAWIIPKNSLLYSIYASVGLVSINQHEISTSQAIYGIIFKEDVLLEYMYYYLVYFKKNLHKYIETGTQGNLNAKLLKNFEVLIPSIDEQEKIANFLSFVDQKIDLINSQLNQAKKFKQFLLQHLFINITSILNFLIIFL